LNGVGYSIPFYATSKLNLLPHKSFAFKKNSINASEHINYLWLVGVSQKEIDLKNLCPVPICNGYHFTGMRSRDGQLQKFIFYHSLHMSANNIFSDALIDRLFNEIILGNISQMEALEIFMSAIPSFYCAPIPQHDNILTKLIKIPSKKLDSVFDNITKQ
jgi:hypothetical protein